MVSKLTRNARVLPFQRLTSKNIGIVARIAQEGS